MRTLSGKRLRGEARYLPGLLSLEGRTRQAGKGNLQIKARSSCHCREPEAAEPKEVNPLVGIYSYDAVNLKTGESYRGLTTSEMAEVIHAPGGRVGTLFCHHGNYVNTMKYKGFRLTRHRIHDDSEYMSYLHDTPWFRKFSDEWNELRRQFEVNVDNGHDTV